jgi:hypothetical protein
VYASAGRFFLLNTSERLPLSGWSNIPNEIPAGAAVDILF